MTGGELPNIADAHARMHLSGDGVFTRHCHEWLEREIGCSKALLTHSCTAALEMAALLLDLHEGDEVIMPSFTFVSTANAFVLRGAVPVFVDIRSDTLNIDECLIEAAVTARTKAICVVHYAGVACEMDAIMEIATRLGLWVIEDAAHGILSTYKGKNLGSIGHLAALSFHETKNVISGEGGALLINDPHFVERAEIIREKGTDRSRFFRGEVDKYTWVDIGSSYLPSELVATFLHAQLEQAAFITRRRVEIWNRYQGWFDQLEAESKSHVRSPKVPANCSHNGHMYYLLMPDVDARSRFIASLKFNGVQAVFHYLPLDLSAAGRRYGRAHGSLGVTHAMSEKLVRMPFWLGIEDHMARVLHCADIAMHEALETTVRPDFNL